MAKKVIIDCDPGIDDAFALLLAHGCEELELVAITTVAGNQTLDKVTANALAVASVGGIGGVPIAAGAAVPLVRPQRVAADYVGETGMDGPQLPRPSISLDERHAVDLITELVMGHDPGEITLVPIGPLTNIALAIRREPAIVERVAEVVLMGGGYSRGNVTPAAEFNIVVDPEAASAVFSADWPVTMVGLDLTHQAVATPEDEERILAVGSEAASFLVEGLRFYRSAYQVLEQIPNPPIHDPCAVARVIDPTIVSVRDANVQVELAGTHTAGMTVCDFLGRGGAPLRTKVAVDLERERFWDLVVGALAALA